MKVQVAEVLRLEPEILLAFPRTARVIILLRVQCGTLTPGKWPLYATFGPVDFFN
jgi:hypothetical protein